MLSHIPNRPGEITLREMILAVKAISVLSGESEGSIDGEERGLTTLCTVPLAYTLAAQANFIRSDAG